MSPRRSSTTNGGGANSPDHHDDSSVSRDAVRHSQRIAIQLHQLIAASITVTGLRNGQDILKSLASSARGVFEADESVVLLDAGFAAPLRSVARRGKKTICEVPTELHSQDFPSTWEFGSETRFDNDWLVAPILERRDRARGVIGVRRGTPFEDEDKEVLVLLAQMASSALGALELRELWSEVLRGGSVDGRDFVDVEIAGKLRVLSASAALLAPTGTETPGLLTLIDDVTNHRELKAELRHAYTMEIRGQVASRIAHDFNNLLTLISGYAEILTGDLVDNERAVQMVKEIQSTASRASMLTTQLQAIARTRAPELVVFNPVTILQSNAEVLERILGSNIE